MQRSSLVTLMVLLGFLAACQRGRSADATRSGGSPAVAIPSTTAEAPSTDGGGATEDPEALITAMNRFTGAVRDLDTKGFMTLFSTKNPWHHVMTTVDPPQVDTIDYSTLEKDLAAKSGYYELLLEAEDEDCFRDFVMAAEGKPWPREGERRFVPPEGLGEGRVWVRWRKEDGRWVVDEIAQPAS